MSNSVVYKRELCFVSESMIFHRKAKGRLLNMRSVGVTRAGPSSTDHPADDAGTSEALWDLSALLGTPEFNASPNLEYAIIILRMVQ